MVREESAELARLWARLNTARLRRFAIAFKGEECVICFLGNRGRSCWDFTTQDADVFVEKTPDNCAALVLALRELGFALTDTQASEVSQGKDFIQLKNGPFDLDFIFAPDGIERFTDAWKRRVEVEGFHVCHIDDIIASKAATHRQKDIVSLPRLRSFREYWLRQRAR